MKAPDLSQTDVPANVPEQLRRLRASRAMTQADLAAALGVQVVTVSRWENGHRRPSNAVWRQLLRLELDGAPGTGSTHNRPPNGDSPLDQPALDQSAVEAPAPLNALIGREGLLTELTDLLLGSTSCLLTLTGTAGAGKTRVALAIAERLQQRLADGMRLVELAPISDPEQVPSIVATAIGVRDQPGRTILDSVTDHLRPQELLLVLDNCEHLIVPCVTLIDAIRRTCPGVRVLVTSRVPIGVDGEMLRVVPPLDVPAPGDALDAIARTDAVRLFIARARVRRPHFDVTPDNVDAVARICQRLDGLPLAIELAAARVQLLSAPELAGRLEHSLDLLRSNEPLQFDRHQTLRAAIDWSYGLLDGREQSLLACLSVFAGSFSVEAAEGVCTLDHLEEQSASIAGGRRVRSNQQGEIMDSLAVLMDHNLVGRKPGEGEARFGLLETIREFGREQLHERGEAATVQRRHAWYFAGQADEVRHAAPNPQQSAWLERFGADQNNLYGAIGWAIEHGEAQIASQLVAAAWRYWEIHGQLSEGRAWLERVIQLDGDVAPPLWVDVLHGAAVLANAQGDYARSQTLLAQLLPLRRAIADPSGLAGSLGLLGQTENARGNHAEARALLEESADLFHSVEDLHGEVRSRHSLAIVALNLGAYAEAQAVHEHNLVLRHRLGDRRGIAGTLNGLGNARLLQGDNAQARELYRQSLTICRELHDDRSAADQLSNLGNIALQAGEHASAAELYEESLRLRRQVGDKRGIGISLTCLGHVAKAQGDPVRARAHYVAGLALHAELGERMYCAGCLRYLAELAVTQGAMIHAARLFGQAESLRESINIPVPAIARIEYDAAVAAMRATLGATLADAAWAVGRAMTVEAALIAATVEIWSVSSLPAPPDGGATGTPVVRRRGPTILSPREAEVIALLAAGRTNREISHVLTLSVRTVERHIANAYAKIGAGGRADATAYALQHPQGAPS